MLRRLRLFLLVLVAIFWFIIILPYFLIQTQWGAKYASQLISHYNDNYTVRIEQISHSISKPFELRLENVLIQDKSKAITYLSAQKMTTGLKHDDLWQIQALDYLIIENGNIELLSNTTSPSVDFLQLKNVSIRYQNDEKNIILKLNNIYGGIKPWSNHLITERSDSQFNFTIQNVDYNSLNIKSLLIQGSQQDKTLRLNNIGGNINQGFFTAKMNIFSDESLDVEQLNINNINFQSASDSINIIELGNKLPKIAIKQLSITNSSINLPNFAIEKGNVELKNLKYDKYWLLQQSELIFNANNILLYNELIDQPLLQWYSKDNQIIIQQAIANWHDGNFKLSGNWQNDKFCINSIIATGIRYQLPDNWYNAIDFSDYPAFFPSEITIKQFTLMPSLIIDTNPSFPFQFTAFEAFGSDVQLSHLNDKINIEGKISFKADSGTLQTIELKRPDITLFLTPKNMSLTFSSLIEQGVLEGKASLLNDHTVQSLSIDAHTVDSQILSKWYLIDNPVKTDKFSLELSGSLTPNLLNGIFESQGYQYQIKNNKLIER